MAAAADLSSSSLSSYSSSSSSSDDEDIDALCVALVLDCIKEEREEKEKREKRTRRSRSRPKKRAMWTRDWILKRDDLGAYSRLMSELGLDDPKEFKIFLRMDVERFHDLLQKVRPCIEKQDTAMRKSISAGERLAITLRYLATGNSFTDLQYLFRVADCTISGIVQETAEAIYEVLKEDYLKVPSTAEEWEAIATQFAKQWHFPNCLGAIDGKHFAIKAPAGTGSTFYNYKGFHSIILLALVDANCKFIYFDVGRNVRSGDAGVFQASTLYHALERKVLNIPHPQPLPGTDQPQPMVIVGDDAFPLRCYLLKPYPDQAQENRSEKRVFNYRLSRARRCSENAFGLLTQRFRLFGGKINVSPERATAIIKSAVALHNYLLEEKDQAVPVQPESQAESLPNVLQQGGNRHTQEAMRIRDAYRHYFCTIGKVSWQAHLS